MKPGPANDYCTYIHRCSAITVDVLDANGDVLGADALESCRIEVNGCRQMLKPEQTASYGLNKVKRALEKYEDFLSWLIEYSYLRTYDRVDAQLDVKCPKAEAPDSRRRSTRSLRITSDSSCCEWCDFKSLLARWHEWLIEVEDVTKNSADQYKTYVKKLASSVDSVWGMGWFESLSTEVGDVASGKMKECSAFIENAIRNASGKDKKAWQNWRSAFQMFEEFLLDATNSGLVGGVRTTNIRKPIKKAVLKLDKAQSEDVVHLKGLVKDELDGKTVVSFYPHKDLVRMFMSRLKTQGRYYPTHGLLFPTRTVTKIFHGQKGNVWQSWLKNGIENMRVWISSDKWMPLSEVKDLAIRADGSVSITCEGGTVCEVWTKTSRGKMKPECATKGPRDLSIDHVVSLEEEIGKKKGQLKGLRRLTEMFETFKQENGQDLDERREFVWMNDFFNQYGNTLRSSDMRSLLEQDLKLLDLQYELMDTVENTKKGNS